MNNNSMKDMLDILRLAGMTNGTEFLPSDEKEEDVLVNPGHDSCECGSWDCDSCFPDSQDSLSTSSYSPELSFSVSKCPACGHEISSSLHELSCATNDYNTQGQESPLTMGGENLGEMNSLETESNEEPMDQYNAQDDLNDNTSDPSDEETEQAFDLISIIKYMQDMDFSNASRSYSEDELANMSLEELEKVHDEVVGKTTISGQEEPAQQNIAEGSAMRKLGQMENGNKKVVIYKDMEWGEFIVKVFVDGVHQEEADYHTDDKEDAVGTAKAMLAHNSTPDQEIMEWINRINKVGK